MKHENIPKDALRALNNMFNSLKKAGWEPVAVYDGEETERVSSKTEALEAIDSVEESVVKFRHETYPGVHNVVVIPSNGEDVICDYSYKDTDNFGPTMEDL